MVADDPMRRAHWQLFETTRARLPPGRPESGAFCAWLPLGIMGLDPSRSHSIRQPELRAHLCSGSRRRTLPDHTRERSPCNQWPPTFTEECRYVVEDLRAALVAQFPSPRDTQTSGTYDTGSTPTHSTSFGTRRSETWPDPSSYYDDRW